MSRNIVPRTNKGADLGTAEKNWNKLYADAITLRNKDLQMLLNEKTNLNTLTTKGDLYVATGSGEVTRLPAGTDGYTLKSDSGNPQGLVWGPTGARQELTGNMTVTVGNNGDFPTINAALENIVALYYSKYISGGNCPIVTINLLTGFTMEEQILVRSLDLSWIKITGVDPETIINANALTKYYDEIGQSAFLAMDGGFLPIINHLFTMYNSNVNNTGIVAYNNSRAIILPNKGIKNVGNYGVYAYKNSIINAEGTDISGSREIGIFANRGSIINATLANVSGSGTYGICSGRGSIINATSANVSGSGTYGIAVLVGGMINAYGATGSLNQTKNIITSNGIIFQ